jgi:hypothetical protein
MAVGIFGLLALVIGLVVLAGLVFAGVWFIKSAGSIRAGHAMLACPHCAAETPASLEKCQKCGQELR